MSCYPFQLLTAFYLSRFCSEIILASSEAIVGLSWNIFSHQSLRWRNIVFWWLGLLLTAAKPSKIGGWGDKDLENIVQASHNFMNHQCISPGRTLKVVMLCLSLVIHHPDFSFIWLGLFLSWSELLHLYDSSHSPPSCKFLLPAFSQQRGKQGKSEVLEQIQREGCGNLGTSKLL